MKDPTVIWNTNAKMSTIFNRINEFLDLYHRFKNQSAHTFTQIVEIYGCDEHKKAFYQLIKLIKNEITLDGILVGLDQNNHNVDLIKEKTSELIIDLKKSLN